jgi:ABC-2 type transport system ATP-binding protein
MRLAGEGGFLALSSDVQARVDRSPDAVGLDRVSHSYGRTQALIDVTLDLEVGTTALLGRNGAGKSTLCRILTGLAKPTTGTVVREGCDLASQADWQRHHAGTGWLPQTLRLPMSMTLVQYLRYAAWLKGLDAERSEAGLHDALTRTDLHQHSSRRLGHLSGGMLRRAGIAQAIVHDPRLLVLDEPTVGLDPEQRSWFHEVIQELSRDRMVLMSTHLMEDVDVVADRVAILDDGVLLFDDSVTALALRLGSGPSSPEILRAAFQDVVSGRAT